MVKKTKLFAGRNALRVLYRTKMSVTLRHQIFLSYIVMVIFTLVVGFYAIWSLQELNNITNDIIFNSVTIGEKLTKLNDSLLAQDLHEKRFLTLHEQNAENEFWSRSREFKHLLAEIKVSDELKPLVEDVNSSYDKYTALFNKEADSINAGKYGEAREISESGLKENFRKIARSIKDIDLKLKDRQNAGINRSNALSEKALLITFMLNSISFICGVLFATMLAKHLTTAISRIKAATHSIRSGNFDNLPDIEGSYEFTELATSFKEMSVRLKELEETNLDANPLTKLPGNLAIEKELLTRLNETQSFSFCLADLDNFKAFNDRYGYARGSDVIKWMGELLTQIKKDLGGPGDFLGHIGGDDFVIICSPERVKDMCARIVDEFDKGIVSFYDPEDLKKGFIVSIDRNDKPAIFGIMTISVAVVNTDRTLISEPKEIALKVTELKQYAKTFAKSLYIMDRRRIR